MSRMDQPAVSCFEPGGDLLCEGSYRWGQVRGRQEGRLTTASVSAGAYIVGRDGAGWCIGIWYLVHLPQQ